MHSIAIIYRLAAADLILGHQPSISSRLFKDTVCILIEGFNGMLFNGGSLHDLVYNISGL